MIEPMPTAPMGAACPSCPTTAVSTAPSSGTVALARTMGVAMARMRRWVRGPVAAPAEASVIALRHQEVARRLCERPGAVVLPRLDLHAGIAPPGPRYARARICVARQAGAQVIHGEVDCLGQARKRLRRD